MAKGSMLSKAVNFVVWLAGVIVALAVGFGMIGGTLSLPTWLGGATLAMVAGWVVVVLTLVGVVMALLDL